MKKAQVNVIYLGILTVISIVIFGMVFVWFNDLKDNAAVEFNEQHAESLLTNFERNIIQLRAAVETPNGTLRANTSNITVSIPRSIGEETYFVRGDSRDLVLQISGKGLRDRKTIFRKQVYWWNATFKGGVHSGDGEITFNYNRTTGNVTLS